MKKTIFTLIVCLFAFNCVKGDLDSIVVPQKFTLAISASQGGNISTTGGQYNQNTLVSITAKPAEGYEFFGWTGTTASGSSINIKVTSDQTITANFTRSTYTLTIDTVGSGAVAQEVVNSNRGTTEYESGKTIRLTATPQSDYLFYNWKYFLDNNLSGNNSDNPFEVTIDKSKIVTATFEEKLPLVNPDNSDKSNTVGKWKIRKERPGSQRLFAARFVDCEVNEIIFRSDNSFTVITYTSTITGQYSIESESTISLDQDGTNIGRLTDLILTENFISFNIELKGVCDEQLDADKDLTYDEATDPIAPSNTGSQTSLIVLSDSIPCIIETELTSDNANQTITLGDQIQNITIVVTVGSTCTETLEVSSSNLPEGVTMNLDNNQISVAGTPLSSSAGIFDYTISLNVASPTLVLNGTIIIEDNNTTTEMNPNEGEDGTDITTTETNTTNIDIGTSTSTTSTSSTDTTPPVLNLTGALTLVLEKLEPYVELGATAIDDVDGDITTSIIITNSVNSETIGTYDVEYRVEDSAGNVTSKERIVNIVPIVNTGTLTSTTGTASSSTEDSNVSDTSLSTNSETVTSTNNSSRSSSF